MASTLVTALFTASALIATASPSFVNALHTDKPAADRAGKMGLYGWLIGRWEMDSLLYDDAGAQKKGPKLSLIHI